MITQAKREIDYACQLAILVDSGIDFMYTNICNLLLASFKGKGKGRRPGEGHIAPYDFRDNLFCVSFHCGPDGGLRILFCAGLTVFGSFDSWIGSQIMPFCV